MPVASSPHGLSDARWLSSLLPCCVGRLCGTAMWEGANFQRKSLFFLALPTGYGAQHPRSLIFPRFSLLRVAIV